jgi:hypothetical protein
MHRCASGLLAALLYISILGCSSKAAEHADSGPSRGAELLVPTVLKVGLGTECELDGKISPASYNVQDLGASGVPAVSSKDRNMLAKIMKFVRTPTLRFTYLRGEFLVFDAVAGPCAAGAPGYFVLNGACNEYYTPPLDINSTHSSSDCFNPPRPWIEHDPGLGKWSWKHYSDFIRTPQPAGSQPQ